MSAFPIPNVTMRPAGNYQAGATITLADGSTLTATGGVVSVPLNKVPAAIKSGFTMEVSQDCGARLLIVPAGNPLWSAGGSLLLPDGVTTSAINSDGTVVVPNIAAPYYIGQFGFLKAA